MALIIEDRVAETSTSIGTGNFTLAGAITGFRAFDDVMSNGDTCYYVIEAVDGSGVPTGEWETGLGTFNDTDTLVRTTVSRSSNSNAAVNFSAGTKRVGLTITAEQMAGAVNSNEVVQILVSDPNGAILTGGDGKAYYRVPSTLNGMDLVAVAAAVTTTSSSGNPTIQIHNLTQAADMLTTAITIDAGDTDSKDATTPAAIDTANDDVATGDMLRIDVDVSGTGAKGLIVEMQFA